MRGAGAPASFLDSAKLAGGSKFGQQDDQILGPEQTRTCRESVWCLPACVPTYLPACLPASLESLDGPEALVVDLLLQSSTKRIGPATTLAQHLVLTSHSTC